MPKIGCKSEMEKRSRIRELIGLGQTGKGFPISENLYRRIPYPTDIIP